MNIIRLARGALASFSADRIHVWRKAAGDYRWSGALVSEGMAAFASGTGLDAAAAAEAEGISWAREYGIRLLFIQTGAAGTE